MLKGQYNHRISTQSDVALNGPADGEALVFDANTQKWKNKASIVTPADASSVAKGVIQLAGDLSGTATSPTVPGLTSKISTSAINAASGVAGLDASGKLSSSTLPDLSGTYVPQSTATELIRDTMGTALVAGSNITITPNDASNTITIAATGTVTSGNPLVVDVKDYGAKGDGVTDDTAAIIAARNAVLATMNNIASANNIPVVLFFPAGVFKVTSADALMFSPISGTAQQLRGLTIKGISKRSSQILFSSSQSASTDPRQGNLMTLANRVRGLRVSNLSFKSTNANQSFCYLWCSSQNDGTVYPEYGTGAQNDIIWDDIMLSGSWARGWGFDGDSHANLNSEQTWRTCYVSNEATFSDAVIRSGFSPFYAQQDQFLNYSFYDCQFEYASGNFFVADMGGFINVYGGSFINGINTTAGGTWFKMANNSHSYDVKHLTVTGTRFEFRNTNCKLIDSFWGGISAHITFTGIDISNSAIAAGSQAEHEIATFNSTGSTQGYVKFANCFLPGYVTVDLASSAPASQGMIYFEMCGFRNYQSGASLGTSGTFLRKTTGTPNYRFQDCFNTTNT